MATTTASRRNLERPIIKVWNQAKNLEYCEKLELATMLIESVKPIQTVAMSDAIQEEDFPDMGKDFYTIEEAFTLTMKDIKAIYDR